MAELGRWAGYYGVVGSAAGALIGLQFVVLTLIAQRPPPRRGSEVSAAFSTPTVMHFVSALVLSALALAPWNGIGEPALAWGAAGVAGSAYQILVGLRMRRQQAYRPVFEDWLFHLILPLGAYVVLAAAAVTARSCERGALFAIAATTLTLLLVGIHNAWDAVTYHVMTRRPEGDGAENP